LKSKIEGNKARGQAMGINCPAGEGLRAVAEKNSAKEISAASITEL
jgi:hypothetical protein